MIYVTLTGVAFDTDRDLSAAERHILQKLILWRDLAVSLSQFRGKKQDALRLGWGDSGAVYEQGALRSIIRDLEERVALRLKDAKPN
jgi:hypothetical protein